MDKTKPPFLASGLVVKANLIAHEIIWIKELPGYFINTGWKKKRKNQKPDLYLPLKRNQMYRHLRGNMDPLKLCPGISDILKWMHSQDRNLSKMVKKKQQFFASVVLCLWFKHAAAETLYRPSSPNVTKGWKRQNYTSIGIWGGLWSQLRPHLTAGWTKKASWDPNTRSKDWAVSQQL